LGSVDVPPRAADLRLPLLLVVGGKDVDPDDVAQRDAVDASWVDPQENLAGNDTLDLTDDRVLIRDSGTAPNPDPSSPEPSQNVLNFCHRAASAQCFDPGRDFLDLTLRQSADASFRNDPLTATGSQFLE